MESRVPLVVPLEGSGRFTRILAGVPATAGMKSGLVTLNPGEAVGEHTTTGREEAIIILAGRAAVYCAGKLFTSAGADSLVYIPPDTRHDIRNEGGEILRYLYVVTPV